MVSRSKSNSKQKVVKKKVNSKKKTSKNNSKPRNTIKKTSRKSSTKKTTRKTSKGRSSTSKKTNKSPRKKPINKTQTKKIQSKKPKTKKTSTNKTNSSRNKTNSKTIKNNKQNKTSRKTQIKKSPRTNFKSQSILEQELINKLLKEIKSLEQNNYELAKQLEKAQTKKEIIFELQSYLSNLKNQTAVNYNNQNNPTTESLYQTKLELEQTKERSKNKDKLISRLKSLVSSNNSNSKNSNEINITNKNESSNYEEHSLEEIRHTFPSSIDAHLEELRPVEIKVEESRVELKTNKKQSSTEDKIQQTSNEKINNLNNKNNDNKMTEEKINSNENAEKGINPTPEEIIAQRMTQIEQKKEEESKKYQTNKKRGVISAEEAEYFSDKIKEMEHEINKAFIGQSQAVKDVLISVFCDAHSLLEGVPGLAKTLLIETLGLVIDGTIFKRIQFLPDLLPSDIIGGQVFNPKTAEYTIYKGPIFANFVLADEINRAPPKTHAAIMEAMQEKKINIENETFILDRPFFVLATQNPLENKGTYELPEAVLDRFMFKIMLDYPLRKHELQIITENATTKNLKKQVKTVLTKEDVLEIQRKIKKVYISDKIREFIMDLVEATRGKNKNIEGIKFVKYGAGVRASIYLCLAAQANAVYEGRNYVLPDDVLAVAYSVLRHRVVINYRGKAHNITPEKIVEEILSKVKAL